MTGECLISLNNNNIEEICLRDTKNIQGKYLIVSFPYFVKLHTIEFTCFTANNFDEVAESLSLCSKLTKVTMMDIENYLCDD